VRNGRERPHELFGRLKAEKVGSLPPNLVFFPVSLFSFSCPLFPRFPETYARHNVKKMVKTKLKNVIPTFCTCFAQVLAAHTERSVSLGWSDPRLSLDTEPCAKVGSLQPISVPSRGQIVRFVVRNFFSILNLLDRKGEPEGERQGEQSVSCTVHLPALQIGIEAHRK